MLKVLMICEETGCLLHCHFQHLRNAFAMQLDFEPFLRETVSFAHRTDGFDISHELQTCNNDSIACTMLTPGAVRVGETEINRLIAALHRLRL
ncbi:hypothetical protein D3C79_844500 [compost metagenome]